VANDAQALRDEKLRLYRQMPAWDPENLVRGQYRGYENEDGVQAGSDTETYAALEFEIDSWRWAGAPWLVRAGKSMTTTATEAVVEFNAPPRMLFAPDGAQAPSPTRLVFQLGNQGGIELRLQAKAAGDEMQTKDVELEVSHEELFEGEVDAYDRL